MIDGKKAFDAFHDLLNPCEKLIEKLATELKEDAPLQLHQGGVIADGIDADLDELRNISSGGATSGLACSLACTSDQGLELENPNNKPFADKTKSNSKYFSSTSGFKSVGPNAPTPATEK